MGAIYDTLMRYDTGTAKYEPQTAESLTASADSTEYTLKIKPSITFTDGTPYDATAVMFGLNRHRSGTPGASACAALVACPRNSQSTASFMALVKDIAVVDPLTVTITLNQPWSQFAFALTTEAGMIPSPTALQKCDGSKSPAQCDFNLKPVGAGPFMVESFKPKDSINLVRNPNYWGGPAYLDGIKFTDRGDGGGSSTYLEFKSGQTQMAFLYPPDVVSQAKADNTPGFAFPVQTGRMIVMNTGATVPCASGKPAPLCVGKPDGPVTTSPATKDVKVRQAIAAAVDPKVLNDRVYQGKARAGSQLLQGDFRWYPNVPGPTYNPTKAKQLVADAKAAGWDGKVRFLASNTPSGQAEGLAMQAMLQAAGMEVALDASKDVAGVFTAIAVQKDFDLAGFGTSISNDDGALAAVIQQFQSDSLSNRTGFKSPTIDQAIKSILAATTDNQKKAGYKIIAEEVANQVPVLPTAEFEYYVAWNAKVHGVTPTTRLNVLLNKAWIEK